MTLLKITNFFTELFQTSFSIVKIFLLSKWFVSFKKYRSQKDECVILGNGPSLTKDLEINSGFINEHVKICVNLFAFSKEYETIKPDYYVLAAPEFWLVNATEFHKAQRTKLAADISARTFWQMKLFIPFAAKGSEFCQKVITNKNIELIYYNNTSVEGLARIINLFFKANLGMPRPHNVLIPTIYLAINIGFKKIFVFGADHSWHEEIKIDSSNKITVNHEHFYEKQEIRMPMYKLDGKQYFLHDVFRKLHYAFKGYFILNSYADYMNTRILNASSKSYIDAFERVIIERDL
jgi:hypothetical protein